MKTPDHIFLLSTFLLGFVCVLVMVPVIRKLAVRGDLLDIPNKRSSHTRVIPRGGGVAIVVAILLGIFLSLVFGLIQTRSSILFFFGGALLVAIISWIDDTKSLSPATRFTFQSISAGLVIFGVGFFSQIDFGLLGIFQATPWVGVVLTFVWIVGLTNAYNFMDGIDGIAGGQAVVAGLGWAVYGWLMAEPFLGVSGLLLASSSAGFLVYNWAPAKIFMGDVGSASIGYIVAVLPLFVSARDGFAPLVGFEMVWPFVFDTSITFVRRLLKGERFWEAHRSHLYQRLVIAGWTHPQVSALYIILSILGVICALATRTGYITPVTGIALIVLCAIGLWGFVAMVESKKRSEFLVSTVGKDAR